MCFSERLKELRLRRGLTQSQLADHLGVSSITISSYEIHKKKIPRMEILMRMAKFFNTSIDYLVGYEDKNLSLQKVKEIILNKEEIMYNGRKLSEEEREHYINMIFDALDQEQKIGKDKLLKTVRKEIRNHYNNI